MEEHYRKEPALVACSESHAVAVGNYGHLYVWGSSLTSKKLVEEISECSSDSGKSSTYQFMFDDEFTEKLGFSDLSLHSIKKPVFYSLQHPVYEIRASQVACARNFTAVVAEEKGIQDLPEESEYEKILFEREIDEFPSEFRQPQDLIQEADHRKSLIANKIRQEVEDYLKRNCITFIELFRSQHIKLESFVNIMTQIIETEFKEPEILEFVDYKKMRLAGKSITLKPLYELIVKCRQGKGVLYILGQKEKIVPTLADIPKAHTIHHNTLSYHLIQLPDQISVLKVACGDNFVLFLTHQGTVYSWGNQPSPSLGKNRSPTYQTIKPIPELNLNNSYIKDICCGVNHCLALNVTGVVFTWGEGTLGKLGNGRLDNCARAEPISIHNNDVLMIRAGHHSSFCKTRDKRYFAWGDISSQKFGPSQTTRSDKPLSFFYDFEIIDMAIGTKSCIFISLNGLLYQSLLFQSSQSDALTCLNRKYKHLEGIQFNQVCAFGSTFFALSSKGSIYSWNLDDEEDLLGRSHEASIPSEISSCSQHFRMKEFEDMSVTVENNREPSRQIVKVACTEDNTFLVTDKGEAIACGDNCLGQLCLVLGDIDTEDNPDEFEEFYLIPRLSMNFNIFIRSIECGTHHVLAVNEDFRAMAWGANSCGQLGNGAFSKCEKYPEVIQALKQEPVEMVSAGSNFSLVLTVKGEVFAFGSAEFGKLGVGRVNPSVMYSLPTRVKNLKGIKRISCGEAHSAAINSLDEIVVWGYGRNGQLGCGVKETLFEPTTILTHNSWKEVSCGATHTLALSTTGTTFHFGEVCLDQEDPELLIPTKVKGLEEIIIKKVLASNKHSLALTENGSALYSWGVQMYDRVIGAKFDNNQITKACSITVPYNEKIVDVSLGQYHGVFVTDHGKVYTWGYAFGGRLGEKLEPGKISKPHEGKFVDLSHVLMKNDVEVKEDLKSDLQTLLQSESLNSKEVYIREVDQQILNKFKECIDFFIQVANLDQDQQAFFNIVEHKQLNRLQQEPFKAELVLNHSQREEIEKRLQGWSALITTYQVHSCYMFKLLNLKLKEEKKTELLGLIYGDMEKDLRLIYTSVYLARMLLDKLLSQPGITFPSFLDSPEASTYKALVNMIVSSSTEDMKIFRKIAAETLLVLSQVVNADENGIDLDPTHTSKNISTIKITSYQMNKNIIDRRMGKLKQVLGNLFKILEESRTKESFSDIIYLICKDFFSSCSKVFEISYKSFERLNDNSRDCIHAVLKIVFEPLCKMLENPDKFYVVYDFLFENKEYNLKSLSETVRKFFEGTELGTPSERWLSEVNKFMFTEDCIKLKARIVSKILSNKADLEELYLESIFLHSLAPFDKDITVQGTSLMFLHRITDKYFESLRVNNPSFDPLALILKDLSPFPESKLFARHDSINLSLFTRCLRQDQSLVRCPTCQMLISRDMAPSKFSPVIEIFDPMPPNSSEAIMTYVLATGPRKQRKTKIMDYVLAFEENYYKYLKDFSVAEKIGNLINCIDTITSSALEIGIEDADQVSRDAIERNREKVFKTIEDNCLVQYKRRVRHIKTQMKISNSLYNLENVLKSKKSSTLLSNEMKNKLLFNVEYGASNLELENYSDSVMFSIFISKVREYTAKKEMSINLFENLTNEMKDNLRGFMKRSLDSLVKKGIIYDFNLSYKYRSKDIIFCFELDTGCLVIIATNSPKKINFCGRDEFREEELLFYEKILDTEIAEMRENCKACENKYKLTFELPKKESELKIVVSIEKLIQLVGEIEDKVSAYIQNMKISQSANRNNISHRMVKKDPTNLETLDNETPRSNSKHNK